MSLNPDVTSVTSFTILNSGLDDLSSSTLRYRYRPVASSKKSRFLRLLHYIVFKVRLPPWLFVSRDSLYILTNLSPFVNAFYKKSLKNFLKPDKAQALSGFYGYKKFVTGYTVLLQQFGYHSVRRCHQPAKLSSALSSASLLPLAPMYSFSLGSVPEGRTQSQPSPSVK